MSTVRDLPVPTVRNGGAREATPNGTLPLGTVLADRYRVLQLLGRGGMGVVYRARDLSLDLDIALKVILRDVADDDQRLAFVRNEVRVARMVTHPNVCRLHDLVEADGDRFITMEYVAGESLAEHLRRESIPLHRAIEILRDVAAGLAAAHAAGVVHRDLKPSNVLLAADRALILDFGIAGEGRVLGTGPQDIAGTTGYMAPEQARGDRVDARADVYAFGVLACVLATGRRPPPSVPTRSDVGGGSAAALPVEDVQPYLAMLPVELGSLIEACLAHEPGDRPADARVLLARLSAAPPPAATTQRTQPGGRRRTWPIVLAGVTAAGLAVGVLTLVRSDEPAAVATEAAAPRFAIRPFTVTGAPGWHGPALQRLVALELVDAYGLDARAIDADHPADATWRSLDGVLTRDPGGALRVRLGDATANGAALRGVAQELARILVERHVSPARVAPTAEDLRVSGTQHVEAWRLWRRAQRESMLQRWPRATELCNRALALDPRFALAALERAHINDNKDALARTQLREAVALLDGVPARPLWRASAKLSEQLMANDAAGALATYREIRAGELDARERLYIDVRFALAQYYTLSAKAALPALELLTETYPDDASAFKRLATYHASSDAPTAPALALRYARRAVALAPDDVGVRTDLALALLQAGQPDAARAHALEVDAADPDDKRLATTRLFTLHLALDDAAAAEVDARRLLTGSPAQQADGRAQLATLDLYWGRVVAGVRGLVEAADAFDAIGHSVSSGRVRMLAARHALAIDDRATAARELARVAAGPTSHAPLAGVLERIAANALPEARARTARLPAGSLDRAAAELELAEATRDHAGVLAAYTRVEAHSASVRFQSAVGAALEATGRPDAAAASYLRVARASHVEPLASGRAWYRLGLLRARAGDRAGARDAFARVVARWDRATTKLPEVADARARLKR